LIALCAFLFSRSEPLKDYSWPFGAKMDDTDTDFVIHLHQWLVMVDLGTRPLPKKLHGSHHTIPAVIINQPLFSLALPQKHVPTIFNATSTTKYLNE